MAPEVSEQVADHVAVRAQDRLLVGDLLHEPQRFDEGRAFGEGVRQLDRQASAFGEWSTVSRQRTNGLDAMRFSPGSAIAAVSVSASASA